MNLFLRSLCAAFLLLSACSNETTRVPAASPTPLQLASPASLPTLTALFLPTAIPSPATPSPSTTPLITPALCSPLQDIALEQLPGLISNPYHPPAPGSDDPHHGVDLAIKMTGSDIAVSGHPVQAILSGQVAAVLNDRFPYGNAVLVETALENAPADWWQPAEIPAPAATLENHSALTCPAWAPPAADETRRSLYVLYAHLLNPAQLKNGDILSCGQAFGAVGSSGNTLNPHLHLETRVGPAGMQFASMAHYDNSATNAEMSSYCLWRISGLFQLVDPTKILALPSSQAAPP